MHVLFLTDNFPPEVNAPASRTYEHCQLWVAAGHQVTVITCAPNFPLGRVFEGYRNVPWKRETISGIKVIRVWSYITANQGFARRVLDYLSFMVSATLAAVFVGHVDVVVGTSPQFFTACAAHFAGKLKRRPWVFEVRDLWPESIKAVGAMQQSTAIRWLERLELYLYRRATRIVSVTASFKRILVARGIDGTKIDVVTNGVDLTHFSPRPKDAELSQQLGLAGKFVVGYIGTHGMAHALETILEAARRVDSMPGGEDIRFVLLGDGARKVELKTAAQTMALRNVLFVDTVPKAEVARYWSLLDISVIHLRRAELFTAVIPSKLFEGMGMGIPVLHGVAGESAEIVLREGVGEVFEPEDAHGLAERLVALAADPVLVATYRGRCLQAAGRYNRSNLADLMLECFASASGTR